MTEDYNKLFYIDQAVNQMFKRVLTEGLALGLDNVGQPI